MAMGELKGQAATLQVEMVCLDELVPADDRYRRLDALVDWSFVREEAEPYYADELGRPSIDPIVLVKLLVAGALEGIGSARELVQTASMRLDLRRFLGYGFSERLPAHQTLSHAQTRRFVDGALFERLFLRSLALCAEQGLLDGSHLSVDAFHAEANAALASLRASLAAAAEPAPQADGEETALSLEPEPQAGQQAQLRVAEPRSGPRPRQVGQNARSRSTTDPEARLRHKPGQRPHLVYRAQIAVDPKARCVVACLGERAEGHEGDGLLALVERARFSSRSLVSVGADRGFAAVRVWDELAAQGLLAYVPPQRSMLPPDGHPRTQTQRKALAARERCRSDRGRWAHGRRRADAEGVVSELKTQGALARARSRGAPLFHLQLLLGCAAINYKRLADQGGRAGSGVAAAPAAKAAISAAKRCLPPLGSALPLAAEGSFASSPSFCLRWSYAVSLN